MDEKQFEKLLEQAGGLSPDQFKRLVQTYANDSALDTGRVWSSTAYSVSEQKLAALSINRACPGCGSVTVVQNGASNAGIQRFRCQDCGQSFTRFSGTLLEKCRFPWDVWVEVLRMVLNDDSLEVMKTVLEQDFGCERHQHQNHFRHAPEADPRDVRHRAAQTHQRDPMDETYIRESQKGHNLELTSYVKGIERIARYGRNPSELGVMSVEFATILTAIDSRRYCVCQVVSLGRATPYAVIDLYEHHCIDAAFLCSDGNSIYVDACDLLDKTFDTGYKLIILNFPT